MDGMRQYSRIFIGVLVVALFGFIFFNAQGVVRTLRRARLLFLGLRDAAFSYERFRELERENRELRFLGCRDASPCVQRENDFSRERAEVYSHYPFSDRDAFAINKGSVAGIREGMPVLTEAGALVGKIRRVTRMQAEVETLFSPNWNSSVVIGETKIKALVKGGAPPTITFIARGAIVKTNDVVRNVLPDFPLFTPVGTVGSVDSKESAAWITATLEPLYEPEGLETVIILTAFP